MRVRRRGKSQESLRMHVCTYIYIYTDLHTYIQRMCVYVCVIAAGAKNVHLYTYIFTYTFNTYVCVYLYIYGPTTHLSAHANDATQTVHAAVTRKPGS